MIVAHIAIHQQAADLHLQGGLVIKGFMYLYTMYIEKHCVASIQIWGYSNDEGTTHSCDPLHVLLRIPRLTLM